MRLGVRYLAALALVTAAYWFAAVSGLQWTVVPGAGTAVWPAAGIAFAALVIGGVKLWPAVLLGRLLAAVWVNSPQPFWADLMIAAGTAAGAVAPALLVRRAGGLDVRLNSLRDMLWLVLGGAGLGALISGLVGVTALWASGTPAELAPRLLLTWVLGFAVGVVTFGALMLAWSHKEAWRLSPAGWAHLAACMAAVAVAGWLVFFDPMGPEFRTWHVFPALVWAALAFRAKGAALALSITGVQAIWSAVLGVGPLSEFDPAAPLRLLFSQQFVASTAVTILILAAVADERRAADQLARSARDLAEEREALKTLNATGSAIAADLDVGGVVQKVTDAGLALTRARFGAFFYNVSDEQGESYTLYALAGAPREAFERFGHPRNTPVFGPTFAGEAIVRSDDITQDPRYGTMAPHYGMPKGHLPVRSYLAAPVRLRSGEVIGGLFFGHPEAGVFTERSEQLLEGLAAQAAVALDNARLYLDAQREISARRRSEEHLGLLIHELNHRVKNTLATVQSIAAQTLRAGDDPRALKEAFTARLLALSSAHDVLTRQRWEGAELAEIARAAIRPFEADARRFQLEGPRVWLEPKPALAIAMALHELAVNAAKYGALSVETGRVSLTWARAAGGVLALTWRESGGPRVSPPRRLGFGSRLIERGLAGELGGEARLAFKPSGLVCTITARLAEPAAPAPRPELQPSG